MHIIAEGKQGRTFIARLKPGHELVQSVQALLTEKQVSAGYIPVLQGGFKKLKLLSMTFGEHEDHPQNVELEYRQPLEYFGAGTITLANGSPSIHVHLTAAQAGNQSVSGHLISGEIALLTEIVIVEITGIEMVRKEDPDVLDLPLLHFGK